MFLWIFIIWEYLSFTRSYLNKYLDAEECATHYKSLTGAITFSIIKQRSKCNNNVKDIYIYTNGSLTTSSLDKFVVSTESSETLLWLLA